MNILRVVSIMDYRSIDNTQARLTLLSVKRVLCCLLFALVLSADHFRLFAQQDKSSKPGQDKPSADLGEMSIEDLMKIEVQTVYGASKHMQKVTEAPASVSIVSAEAIQKYGYRTLADALSGSRRALTSATAITAISAHTVRELEQRLDAWV
jgi:hypothetical protein